jgi:hypothetical protein
MIMKIKPGNMKIFNFQSAYPNDVTKMHVPGHAGYGEFPSPAISMNCIAIYINSMELLVACMRFNIVCMNYGEQFAFNPFSLF